MKKKLLVVACVVSMMALCACDLPIVSESEYNAVVAEKDAYIEECSELASEVESYEAEVESLNSEIVDLQTEVALLETENINLTSELEDAKDSAIPGLGDEIIFEISDKAALKFRLPEGFKELEKDTYGPGNMDTSNIILRTEKTNSYNLDFTQEDLENQLLTSYEALGLEIDDIEFKTFEWGEVNGYDTLIIDMEYELAGNSLQQIEFIIQVENNTCVIVYTTAEQFGWYEDYLKSADTIQIGFVE
ncbi:MAG: hypothetical protein J6A73_07850 [Lachnospiraceae bacterium]|nr:hypothetical protein [Lachnospiraceae bacterium]